MIEIRCDTRDYLKLGNMSPFQGDLKSRTEGQVEELKRSLLDEGLLAPFFIWTGFYDGAGRNWIIDGHARYEALTSIYKDTGDDEMFFHQDFPVVYIEADSAKEAKKALLQITSSYGKVTKYGARHFCKELPGYKAPSVAKFLKPAKPIDEKITFEEGVKVATGEEMYSRPPKAAVEESIMKIAVKKEFEHDLRELLGSMSYIRIL